MVRSAKDNTTKLNESVRKKRHRQRKSICSQNNWIFASDHRCCKQLRIQKCLIDLVYVGQRCQLVMFNSSCLLVGLLNCFDLMLPNETTTIFICKFAHPWEWRARLPSFRMAKSLNQLIRCEQNKKNNATHPSIFYHKYEATAPEK